MQAKVVAAMEVGTRHLECNFTLSISLPFMRTFVHCISITSLMVLIW
jgi:hypothetical protein